MKTNQDMRNAINHSLDALEMIAFNQGFEAAINAIDEMSNVAHNKGNKADAQAFIWLAAELRGENV